MSLLSMPAEVLHQICRFIGKINIFSSDLVVFRSLSLSCRFFYKFVLPYQYRCVSLGVHGVFLLLRSVVEKPKLALAIEEFTIDSPKGGRPDLGKAYTLLRKSGVLPKGRARHLHPDDYETISVLLAEALILQLSNAKDLTINLDSFPQNTVFFDKRRWKSGSAAYLSQRVPALNALSIYVNPGLHKVDKAEQDLQEDERELDDDEEESDEEERRSRLRKDLLGQSQYLAALSKPSTLYFETDYYLNCSCFDLTLPSVETLDISCEGMTEEDLELLIAACPNIRSFRYAGGMGSPQSDYDDWDEEPINLRTVVTALRHRQHALETLEIGFFQDDGDGYIMRYDTCPDLRQFSRLINLELHWNALFNVPQDTIYLPIQDANIEFIDKLPRTLEKLHVFQAEEIHLQEFKSLAHRKAEDLPNFRNLTLEWWYGASAGPLVDLEDELLKADIKLARV